MKVFYTLSLAFLLFACNKDVEDNKNEFSKQELVNQQVKLVDEYFTDFIDKATVLNNTINEFSNKKDEDSKLKAENSWRNFVLSWQSIQFYYVKDLKYSLQETEIAYWPTDTISVKENLNLSAENINPNWISTQGANKKGLFSLEYLLFSVPNSTDSYFSYLKVVSQNILNASIKLKSIWQNDYKQDFKTSVDNYVTSTIPIIANRLVEIAEKNKNQRLGYPLGKIKYTTTDPLKLESIYAKYSLEIIKENVKVVKNIYLGDKSIGFDDYLKSMGENGVEIDKTIKNKFKNLVNSSEKATLSITDNIVTKDSEYIQIMEDWRALIQSFKADMLSQLSITPTFSDADGD